MGVQVAPCEGAIFVGKDMLADFSPFDANALVHRWRSGGIIAHRGLVHSSLQGVTGLTNTIQPSMCRGCAALSKTAC